MILDFRFFILLLMIIDDTYIRQLIDEIEEAITERASAIEINGDGEYKMSLIELEHGNAWVDVVVPLRNKELNIPGVQISLFTREDNKVLRKRKGDRWELMEAKITKHRGSKRRIINFKGAERVELGRLRARFLFGPVKHDKNIYVHYKDGNPLNDSLENIYLGVSAPRPNVGHTKKHGNEENKENEEVNVQ